MWRSKAFDQLTAGELHAIYALRTAVFVVEQACAYQEVDEADLVAHHLWWEEDGQILAYCRLIPAGDQIKLGRVVVASDRRGTGLARNLVAKALQMQDQLFPNQPIFAQAQSHLTDFYASFGFTAISATYLEDGIPHVDMIKEVP